jgi:hypothetical protein
MVLAEVVRFCDAITEAVEVAAPIRARSWQSKKVKPSQLTWEAEVLPGHYLRPEATEAILKW